MRHYHHPNLRSHRRLWQCRTLDPTDHCRRHRSSDAGAVAGQIGKIRRRPYIRHRAATRTSGRAACPRRRTTCGGVVGQAAEMHARASLERATPSAVRAAHHATQCLLIHPGRRPRCIPQRPFALSISLDHYLSRLPPLTPIAGNAALTSAHNRSARQSRRARRAGRRIQVGTAPGMRSDHP